MLVVPAEESEMIEILGQNDPVRRVGRFSQRRLMPPLENEGWSGPRALAVTGRQG